MATAIPVKRSSASRYLHLVLGIMLFVAAVGTAAAVDAGPWPVLLFAILPDLAFVAAVGQPHEPGQLPARAVPLYNLLHRPVLPLLLLAASTAGTPGYWTVASLTWGAHIAFDRAAGYGLRTRDGWQGA